MTTFRLAIVRNIQNLMADNCFDLFVQTQFQLDGFVYMCRTHIRVYVIAIV